MKEIPGSVVAPSGFLAAGVFCDIKRLGTGKGSDKGRKRDLALIVTETPATAAGLFTTNQVCAAPVKVCLEHLKAGAAQAIVANSGNANACTGRQGLKDARAMAELAAAACERALNGGAPGRGSSLTRLSGTLSRRTGEGRGEGTSVSLIWPAATLSRRTGEGRGEGSGTLSRRTGEGRGEGPSEPIAPSHVFVASTGRIGVAMPMDNVASGIQAASLELGRDPAHGAAAAEAILTSDTHAKQIAVEFKLGRHTARLGGICKGAGMIQPGMSASGRRPPAVPHATMLCFLTTDVAIEAKPLQACLEHAVACSFNRITVDGDMSTNDTVLLLANGQAGNENSKFKIQNSKERGVFQAALDQVCLELAKMIVRDGEGVTRFVTVRVTGARNAAEADAAARAVANSALVKTSWFGGDPNWGRIIDALGYSSARIVEEKVDIGYSAPGDRKVLWSLRRGQPTAATFKELCAAVAPKEFDLHIRLGSGKGDALIYAADLTTEYVDFNKGDVSDPAALGG